MLLVSERIWTHPAMCVCNKLFLNNTNGTKMNKTHFGCEVTTSRQVFEAKKTVPLAGSTSTGVVVYNL